MSSKAIEVVSWKDLSTIDVLEHTSSVFFFPGCNFRCPWCQNLEVVFPERTVILGEKKLREMLSSWSLLAEYVQASGGEPTLHIDQVSFLFSLAKEYGMKTSLNTNGSSPEAIEELISKGLLDHVAIDVKAPLKDEKKYWKIIGKEIPKICEKVLRSLEICANSGIEVEVRTTCLGVLSREEILEIAKEVEKYSPTYYVLQEYFPPAWAPKEFFRKFSPEEIKELANELSREVSLRVAYRLLGESKVLGMKKQRL